MTKEEPVIARRIAPKWRRHSVQRDNLINKVLSLGKAGIASLKNVRNDKKGHVIARIANGKVVCETKQSNIQDTP